MADATIRLTIRLSIIFEEIHATGGSAEASRGSMETLNEALTSIINQSNSIEAKWRGGEIGIAQSLASGKCLSLKLASRRFVAL